MTAHTAYIVIAFIVGGTLGILCMALVVAGRDPFNVDLESDRPTDTELLDYLETSEHGLLFNKNVNGGAWGVIASPDKVLAVGKTVRDALDRGRSKDIAELEANLRPLEVTP